MPRYDPIGVYAAAPMSLPTTLTLGLIAAALLIHLRKADSPSCAAASSMCYGYAQAYAASAWHGRLLLKFGLELYVNRLALSRQALVHVTVGKQGNLRTTFHPAWPLPDISQFGLLLQPDRSQAFSQGGEELLACYTTLLKAVPYKVGTVHVQASRNGPAKKCYMLPCNGCPDRSGHIKKEITAEGQLAGPRYLTTRKFSVNKFGLIKDFASGN
ncbi:hypothetical protein C6P46_000355 [Rhodotorula mucilaginosa]|uniref:Uncharacterized protein n=1 Tax=Rhodotorula mucilaginosa TaxID=5537 RepID=A0A9P6VVQ5_RHOMI|nr:hypothetical protein C6P46_000355 [Rhodotorula mucilaginosa]